MTLICAQNRRKIIWRSRLFLSLLDACLSNPTWTSYSVGSSTQDYPPVHPMKISYPQMTKAQPKGLENKISARKNTQYRKWTVQIFQVPPIQRLFPLVGLPSHSLSLSVSSSSNLCTIGSLKLSFKLAYMYMYVHTKILRF